MAATLQNLPTAARLVASICLAIAGIVIYFVLVAQYPDDPTDGAFRLERHQRGFLGLFAAVGIFVGWRGLGTKASGHAGSGFTLGIQAAIAVVLWSVLALVIRYGSVKMMKNAYGSNTVGAILDMFNQGLFYLSFMLDPFVLGCTAAAGAISGMITVSAGKTWR